ncbi:group 1 truncated hemoglobin [Actinomycetospora sp.]|uniref:group I truncated hemoglobin n=1 Tax=Actinomycetospora sp. TaxID=1872135 RepID=UPI002F3ED648
MRADTVGQITFHDRLEVDTPGYKFLVTAWSIEAAGGPKCYPGLSMVTAHETLAITSEQFDAVAFEIAATLNFLGVPAAEHKEFMDVIEHYRPEVTKQEPVDRAGTLEPAVAQA